MSDLVRPDDWPTGRYGAILADPPWRFRTWSETNQSRAASRHYPLMTLSEICALPVAELAAPDCVLFLWVTRPMLRQAFTVADACKTVAFSWTKTTKHGKEHMGLGYWSRANPEQCWLFTRGKPKRLPTGRSVRERTVGTCYRGPTAPPDRHPASASPRAGSAHRPTWSRNPTRSSAAYPRRDPR